MVYLDAFLNKITIYRLMLYFLLLLLVVAIILSAVGLLAYAVLDIFLQAIFLVVTCWAANRLLAGLFKIKSNPESPIITGLILTLIMGPTSLLLGYQTMLLAGILAMASKYFITVKQSHIFNPAALGVVGSAIILNEPASWWIADGPMSPFIIVGGLLTLYRLKRSALAVAFLSSYSVLIIFSFFIRGGGLGDIILTFNNLFLLSPLVFFTVVMLIEPLTSPKIRQHQIYYGALVALVFFGLPRIAPAITFPLELTLLIGNIFSRAIGRDFKQTFTLRRRENFGPNLIGFWFEPIRPFKFNPGQFLEYTISHHRPDSRGLRRYFTIASSPTELEILLATKLSDQGSSFKQKLHSLEVGDQITASNVAGDFTLPADPAKKLVFIAGGIGITPFRSMIKYLLDSGESRDIILIYAGRTVNDLIFKNLFEEAGPKINLKNVYVLSEEKTVPTDWTGRTGLITAELIKAEVPDFTSRLFYVSGPEPMVKAMEKILVGLDLSRGQIKRDYFPGYE